MVIMKTKMMIRDQNGGAVVEFAIILPLLIVLLFGSVEFGLLLYNKQIITSACREGARAGIVSRTPGLSNDAIEDEVIKYGKAYLVTFGSDTLEKADIDLLTINNNSTTFNPATDRCTSFGCDLKVVVTYDYDFLVLSAFGPITLNAKTIMKME